MEQAGSSKSGNVSDEKPSSPDKDDSLKDFKSSKTESASKAVFSKAKVVIDKQTKKVNSKTKSSARSKKKEPSVKKQPSIESSFFKTNNTKKEGHTCPLCMRYFEDVYAGTAHTKNCAAKNKVSTTKLLAAVALQERQTDERLALGLPAGPILQYKDKTPRRHRAAISKDDPDMQLAVALSKSLHDNKVEEELEEALLLAADHRGDEPIAVMTDSQRRQTLKNFGFLTKKPISEVPIRPRRKKHLGPTILQTRSQESRDRLLTERIAEILMGNEAITQVCQHGSMAEVKTNKQRSVVLQSRLLKEIHQTTKPLWDSAKLSKEVTNFYVEELGDSVMPVADKQQEDTSILTEENPEGSRTESPGVSNEFPIDDNKNKPEKMPRSPDNQMEQAEDRGESPKNIYVTDRQYRNCLVTDWANTLNVSSMSDVVVLVENNHIWAHKLVFHVRCPDILLDCEPMNDEKFPHVKEKICWIDCDYLTALAFLEFVYSGVIVKNEHIFTDDRITASVRTLARKYRLKNLFEYMRKRKSATDKHCDEIEDRKFGLRSPIIIEVPQRKSEINDISDKPSVPKDRMKEPVVSASSPANKSSVVDLTIEETPDSDEQINGNDEQIDMETVDNISFASTLKCCTSPDLFDDTTEEATENTSAAMEANSQISSGEDSNLKILAELIAQDNLSPASDDDGRTTSSTASTYIEDKQSEELKEVSVFEESKKKSISPLDHGETPRSRSFSISVENKISRSRSQRLPEKAKSNLSIFIDKVKKINAKSVLDSFAEDESLGEPYDRGRFRNPFHVNNESKKFIMDNSREETIVEAKPNKKGALSAFEEQLLDHEKKKNCIDPTNADEPTDHNESFSMEISDFEDSSVTDKTTTTDDENVSMYSKYKKSHKHNNSISKYRSLLKKSLVASVAATENLDKSDSFSSAKEESIDLTLESDSEVESSPSSNIGRPIRKKCNDRPLISDNNDSLSSREVAETKEKSFNSLNRHHSICDDDVASKSCDNEKSSISELDTSTHENIKSNATTPARTSPNHRRNMSTSPEYPDPRQSHVNEEIFTQSLINRGTLTPSPSRFDVSNKSSRRKRRIEERQANDKSFTDNSKKDKKASSSFSNRSSADTKTSSHSSQFPDLDVFEIEDQLFNQSFITPQISPRRSLTPSPKSNSVSSQRKRNIDQTKAKNTSLLDYSDEDEDEKIAKNRQSSPHYSDPEMFDVDNHVFTQSFHSPRVSPNRALTPFKTNNDECGRNGSFRNPSPIYISSSPDIDEDIDKHLTNIQNFNKENSFAVAESNFSPLTSKRNTLSPYNEEELVSPKPGPSHRRFSPDRSKVSISSKKNSFVRWNSMPTGTANTQSRLKRTRTPTKSPRLTLSQGVTPKVNYDAMDTPELKRELEKYGIKPQKAHRARQLLTHIYNELHKEVPAAAADEVLSDDEEPPVKKIVTSNNQTSDDSESESVTSTVSVIPEEMEFADADEASSENGDFSSKSSIKQAVTALIKGDKELHNKLLTYEPLPLELLVLMLKARGFKCKVNDLMDFLDEECITFQVQDQARRRKNKGTRGTKTAANKAKKPNSQKS